MGIFRDLLGTVQSTFRIGIGTASVTLDASANTVNRVLIVPDKAGTIATTDDIGSSSSQPTINAGTFFI